MAIPLQQDYFETTLDGAISDSDTTLVLNSEPSTIPDSSEIVLVLDYSSSSLREIVKGVKTGTTISSLERGLGSSSANGHSLGAEIRMAPTAVLHNLVAESINDPDDSGTKSDTFEINSDGNSATLDTVGLTGDQTYTFPDESGEFVIIDGTQTLTNKTLTDPVLDGSITGTGIVNTLGSPGSSDKIPTEEAVRSAIVDSVAGVASFNGETGAVVYSQYANNSIYS